MSRLCLRRITVTFCMLIALTACGSDEPRDTASDATREPGGTATTVSELVGPTPGVAEDVDFRTSFDDAAAEMFFTGETLFGARASILDGRYVVEVEDGEWQTITPGPMLHPTDGVIEADVTLDGAGFAGLVARSSVDARGGDWMYSCLFDESGWAGCVASVGTTYQDLFWGAIDDFDIESSQHMVMTVVGARIELIVNGQPIGNAQHEGVQFGAWGVLAESQDEGTTVVSIDNLVITSSSP